MPIESLRNADQVLGRAYDETLEAVRTTASIDATELDVDLRPLQGGVIDTHTVDSSQWHEALVVDATSYGNITIQNRGTASVLLSYSNTAGPNDGIEIYPSGNASRFISAATSVYIRAVQGATPQLVAVEILGTSRA